LQNADDDDVDDDAVIRCGEQVRPGYQRVDYGCLEFISNGSSEPSSQDQSSSSVDTTLVIGVAVGVGLFVIIIILIIVIVVCVMKSRRKRRLDGPTVGYNNLRADNPGYSDVLTVNTAPGTTRSFMFGNEHLSDKPVESVAVDPY